MEVDQMGLSIKGIALEFGRNLIKPLETGISIGGKIQNEFLGNGATTANLLQNPAGNLSDIFASRSGLSTALNLFKFAITCK
ncbi:MAG: hypothetical protein HC846_03680 [Blastocatellia bacterium]|nr:hypothetical protein [Blastocatellia bacterium]